MIPNVLSIAGSDPSGGAGIQADLKAFAARGVYGMAVITALTAQNTQGVSAIHLAPSDFVAEQIRMVFADISVHAVKIGMIASAEIAEVVAKELESHKEIPIVLDPVMIAKGGARLLNEDAVTVLTKRLLPLSTLVTPNLPEGAALLGEPQAINRSMMEKQVLRLRDLGSTAALLKGGHLSDKDSPDVLADRTGIEWMEGPRHRSCNTHGSGCTLSSVIAAELAKGRPIRQAVYVAKLYLARAIHEADQLSVGRGHGPLHHFHEFWSHEKDISEVGLK